MKMIFTHHAKQQWRCRFSDLSDDIEDEFAEARPASQRIRQIIYSRSYRTVREHRRSGDKPTYFVTRRCVFPCLRKPSGDVVILTVFKRDRP